MPGVAQRFWSASTLQGRRWMMERRLEAVEDNNSEKLKELLTVQGRTKPKELTTFLEKALQKKSDDYGECVRVLLEGGADPDGADGSNTPFIVSAADAGCVNILSLLLDYKANVDCQREDGGSALHRAAWRGHVTCLMTLLGAGADISACDDMGRTPLVVAAQGNKTECVEFLMNNNSNVNIADDNGFTVLTWGAFHDNMQMIQAALPLVTTATLNKQGPRNCTPLHIATYNNNKDLVNLFVKHNCDQNLVDESGRTALNVAAKEENFKCMHILIAGSNVNIADDRMATPLIYCVGYSKLLLKLLRMGADPNVKTVQNLTPLWISCSNNFIKCAKYLLQANANPNVVAGYDNNKLPLQLSLYRGHISITKMIFISCMVSFLNINWLQSYIQEDTNFQQQVQVERNVATATAWIHDVMTLHKPSSPFSLQAHCRKYLRDHLGSTWLWQKIDKLKIPGSIKDYLKLKELDEYDTE